MDVNGRKGTFMDGKGQARRKEENLSSLQRVCPFSVHFRPRKSIYVLSSLSRIVFFCPIFVFLVFPGGWGGIEFF